MPRRGRLMFPIMDCLRNCIARRVHLFAIDNICIFWQELPARVVDVIWWGRVFSMFDLDRNYLKF